MKPLRNLLFLLLALPVAAQTDTVFDADFGTGESINPVDLPATLTAATAVGTWSDFTVTDVLERLPAMTNRDDLGALLPSRWQTASAPAASTAEACLA